MTDYSAYDHGLPCKNPNCALHGKPHPNCKCYGGMANGGSVKRFCDSNQMHDVGCEYYADGGSVAPPPMLDSDPKHSVAGHLSNAGIMGLMRMEMFRDPEKYTRSIKSGHRVIGDKLDSIFNNQRITNEDRSKYHDKIDAWISDGGITSDIRNAMENQHDDQYAHGGSVKPHEGILEKTAIEQTRPDHSIILQTVKGRVANYLDSLKPKDMQQRMPLDDAPDQTIQEKQYKKALEIADQPMAVLKHVSHGTLDQDHMRHLSAMYPEVKDALQKRATEKIIEAQLENKKPNRVMRQGLGSLLESPLSAAMTQPSIAAAQAALAGSKPGQQPQKAPPKSSSSSLSKSDQAFLTGPQSLVKRSQRAS